MIEKGRLRSRHWGLDIIALVWKSFVLDLSDALERRLSFLSFRFLTRDGILAEIVLQWHLSVLIQLFIV